VSVHVAGRGGIAMRFQLIVCLLSTLATWVVVGSWWKLKYLSEIVGRYPVTWRLKFGDDEYEDEPAFRRIATVGELIGGVREQSQIKCTCRLIKLTDVGGSVRVNHRYILRIFWKAQLEAESEGCKSRVCQQVFVVMMECAHW
jgi:hypothetical protein